VSIRQNPHHLTYGRACEKLRETPRKPNFRMYLHTSAYVSIRQHTSACEKLRETPPNFRMYLHTSAYVSTRQHTSAHVSTRQHTPTQLELGGAALGAQGAYAYAL
jgi:hypothetical protein